MPKKLAITIAGAVSLGSYESGVLCEVLDAIRQHNQDPQTGEGERVVVDVVTGASAGGMTAIILAQKLLYNGPDFKGPYDNPLYNTWVKRISLAGLQATQPDEGALQSIFSSDLIETISEETLVARYETVPPPPPQPHPAVDGEIRVGAALTNLNGLPYGYSVTPGGSFTYLDHADQMTRHVAGPASDTREFWEDLRQAAVASGAFPFAFRPKPILRSKAADPDDYSSKNLEWPGDPTTFTYSDGGILQNQPLGMAKNLVDEIDLHLEERRFYLFVSPHAKDPKPVNIAGGIDMLQELKRLVALTIEQSGFQDWITAHDVNERIRLLDDRAKGLAHAIENRDIEVASLGATANAILKLQFPDGSHLPPGAATPETLLAARERIAKQYAEEERDLAAIPGAPEAFRDAVLAFESAAQLGARDLMIIYGVTANDNELAGAGLESFLGFFDQRFRDHDYDVGRTHAQAFLANDVLKQSGQIGPLRYVPGPIRPIVTSLNGLRLDQVPSNDVKPFRQGLRNRVNQMLQELHCRIAEPAADIVVDLIIDHLMPGSKSDAQGNSD